MHFNEACVEPLKVLAICKMTWSNSEREDGEHATAKRAGAERATIERANAKRALVSTTGRDNNKLNKYINPVSPIKTRRQCSDGYNNYYYKNT